MLHHKGYIKDEACFKTLFENTVMVLGHCFENAYLFNKLTKEELGIFQFYGDPTCGLVGKNNDWCLVGGEVLVIKGLLNHTLWVVDDLKDIYGLKMIDEYKTLVLTDPWTEGSAIWLLTIDFSSLSKPLGVSKVRDFKDYFNQPFSEVVIW
ncbi:hypothetical protein [Spirosoma aerolatum]|uniref:hypothetical protein n=1 Tax=Spirosoma aerolatum TaxID=1211326 RepID=UPI0009AD9E6B|nr:hypothetical protein [Spirosoma aerolatum]